MMFMPYILHFNVPSQLWVTIKYLKTYLDWFNNCRITKKMYTLDT